MIHIHQNHFVSDFHMCDKRYGVHKNERCISLNSVNEISFTNFTNISQKLMISFAHYWNST